MVVQELPLRVPLAVSQGATFRKRFRWSLDGAPVNLTGWTGHMQARRFPSAGSVLVNLTETAGLALGADGIIDVLLTAAQTAALPVTRGVYDLRLSYPGGDTIPLAAGDFIVRAAVTRDAP